MSGSRPQDRLSAGTAPGSPQDDSLQWVERPRRRRGIVLLVAVVLAVGVAVGWAAAVVFRPAPDVPVAADYTTTDVVAGEVGAQSSLSVVAAWSRQPGGVNRASGVVTSVAATTGAPAEAGAELYAVDLRPVFAAEGDVPAFRDLAAGAEGDDVAQLQRLLTALGHYDGDDDGVFDAPTAAAVRAWQRDVGVNDDGVVRAGDVVFVGDLPARLIVDGELVSPGTSLAGGEAAVQRLSDAPSFTLEVTREQAARAPEGTAVSIAAPEGETWSAQVGGSAPGEEDGLVLTLESASDGAVCGDACSTIDVGGRTLLDAVVVTDPPVRGLTVPVAALRTDAAGEAYVIDESGGEHAVEVVASVGGMAVVEGVPEGTRVRVPASDAAAG